MKKIFSCIREAELFIPALLFVAFCFASTGKAQSCDSVECHCAAPDLNPAGIMLGHNHPKGTWMFSYRYMNMFMKGNLAGTESINNDRIYQDYIMSPASMNMRMHMLMAMYGITDRLSVMAMFNYNVSSMTMNMLPGTMQMQMNGMTMASAQTSMTSKTSGIGDTKLYASYTLVDRNAHRLVLSAGVSLPTGNIHLKGDEKSMLPGQRLPYMMQLGSGMYDLLPAITYILSKEHMTWGTQLSGIYRIGYNPLGYSLGNELAASSWLAYRVMSWMSVSARAEASVVGSISGKDPQLYEVMEPDAKATNYGGKKVLGLLGVNFYLERLANSRFSLEYGMPFYQNLNGPQLATQSILFAGWGISF